MRTGGKLIAVAVALLWSPAAQAEEGNVAFSFAGLLEGETPGETYALNKLLIVERGDSGDWFPVRGKYRVGISRAAFYRAIGRTEITSRERRREAVADVLRYGGLAAYIGGFLVAATARHENQGQFWLGVGVIAGGYGTRRAARGLYGPVIDAQTGTDLAEEYNQALLEHIESQIPLAPPGSASAPAAQGTTRITLRGQL